MSDNDGFGMFLIGFLVGGVAGAVAALLLAPQSGEETRTLIKDKSIELRDMAAEQVDVMATKAGKVAEDAKARGKELVGSAGKTANEAKARGKELVDSAKKAVAKKPPLEMTGE
jgi:gas vesicle protein